MGTLESRSLKKKVSSKPKRALSKASSTSWDKKMRDKRRKDRVKSLAKHIRDEINDETQRARESRRANRERKLENEKKSMVVQEIKNVRAVKKLTPKQRRKAQIFMKHQL